MSSHLHSSENTEFIKFEYHVIYSFSYNVPVLYFTASRRGILYQLSISTCQTIGLWRLVNLNLFSDIAISRLKVPLFSWLGACSVAEWLGCQT